MSRIDDFSKAGQALAETKRTSVAQAQSRYDFDIAAEYGYQYAVDRACEWLKENIYHRVYECGDRLGFPTADFIKDFRKAMCNG